MTLTPLERARRLRRVLAKRAEFLVEIEIELLEGGRMPERTTERAVGFDVFANSDTVLIRTAPKAPLEKIHYDDVNPGTTFLVPLGFKIYLPGFAFIDIRGRSGLSLSGVQASLGTVDPDYVGEVHAMICDPNRELAKNGPLTGQRLSQMVIQNIPYQATPVLVLSDGNANETSGRGTGGFGSTGTR